MKRRAYIVLSFVAGWLSLAFSSSGADAQYLHEVTLNRLNDLQLAELVKPRIVRIYIKYRIRKLDEDGDVIEGAEEDPKEVFGAGFLVSSAGYLMTARHNVEALYQRDRGDKRYEILEHRFDGFREGEPPLAITYVAKGWIEPLPKAGAPEPSAAEASDIAVLRVVDSNGQDSFPYFCTEFEAIPLGKDAAPLMALKLSQKTSLDHPLWPEKGLRVSDPAFDPKTSRMWQTNGTFDASTSGSPVLRGGAVVGIVSHGWTANGTSLQGGFVYPLNRDDHAAWTNQIKEVPCRHAGDRNMLGPKSQSEFMSGAEGAIAWQPGFPGKGRWADRDASHWVLEDLRTDQIPSYTIRRSDLNPSPKCDGAKVLRLVINHRAPRRSCEIRPAERTFYAIQVTPKYKYDAQGDTLWRVSLHRPQRWFRRSGDRFRAARFPASRCAEGHCERDVPVSPDSFLKRHDGNADLAALDRAFDGIEWHGFARNSAGAHSSAEKSSRYQVFWSSALQFKRAEPLSAILNFLIAYRGTEDRNSKAPPSINLCVNDSWEYFDLTWSSPERCIDQKNVRVRLIR